MKQILSSLWKSFWSAVPKWVIKAQLVAGSIVAFGVSVIATTYTGRLAFLNAWGPEIITFGTVSGLALQFIQKIETVFIAPGDTVTNVSSDTVAVEVPAAQADAIKVDEPGDVPKQ
jgi:hypothetical protein